MSPRQRKLGEVTVTAMPDGSCHAIYYSYQDKIDGRNMWHGKARTVKTAIKRALAHHSKARSKSIKCVICLDTGKHMNTEGTDVFCFCEIGVRVDYKQFRKREIANAQK